MSYENFLGSLNDQQLKAALAIDGPVLVLAGAGSGKTKTLTCRIAHMLKEGIFPRKILAMTFTNKAANEMKRRVIELSGPLGSDVTVSTFHSFGVRILRLNAHLFGYKSNFNIYDTDDQKKLFTQIMKESKLNVFGLTPAKILGRVSKIKESGLSPDQFSEQISNPLDKSLAEIYRIYQQKLKENNSLDFADILIYTLEVLKDKDALERLQSRYHYFMVDEYQDTNQIQYDIIKKLSSKTENLFVVGDEDQSIYGFRGADIYKILNFEKDFPNTQLFKLERNYRSTINILNVANAVIKNNKSSKGKILWTDIEGSKPKIYEARDSLEEANYVTSEIKKYIENKKEYRDIAILYRNNFQSREFEEEFIRNIIPYKIYGGMQFYQRKEIKDIMSYLSLVKNESDNISFLRVVNTPVRGIGNISLSKLEEFALKNKISLLNSIDFTDSVEISSKVKTSLKSFKEIINKAKIISEKDIIETIEYLMDSTGYIKDLTLSNETDRIENIIELMNSIKVFEDKYGKVSLEDYLEQISLSYNVGEESTDNHVKMMTIHSSKGLEFDMIFIVGLEEELLPHARSIFNNEELEEERRLFYVALTRARKNLYITNARNRLVFNSDTYMRSQSRFIDEIPKNHLSFESKVSSKIHKTLIEDNYYDFEEDIGIKKGDKVSHSIFGIGKVLDISDKVSVDFNTYGEKKFSINNVNNFIKKL